MSEQPRAPLSTSDEPRTYPNPSLPTTEPVRAGPGGPPVGDRPLRRSRDDRVVGGVCGGLAEYFGVDPVLIRIAAVALALSGGAGVLAYVIAWIAIPEDGAPAGAPGPAPHRAGSAAGTTVVGAVMVALGGLLLVNRIWPWVNAAVVWPLILVVLGVAVLTSGRRRS